MRSEGIRVLIVDDNAAVNSVLVELFAKRGFEVVGAHSGAEALDLLSKGNFDVILLDLVMPNMNGFAVIEKLRGAGTMLPIVVHSSHVGCLDAGRLKALGATDVFFKPADPKDLIESVRRAAGGTT